MKTENSNFKEKLKQKMHKYLRFIYLITKNFPKEEVYGASSQVLRTTMSIILNYIEGYARKRPAVQLNFFEISYGSLKESKYLLFFEKKKNHGLVRKITKLDYRIQKKSVICFGRKCLLWRKKSENNLF